MAIPSQAHVTSIDALETLRANLVVFRATATQALDEVFAEVKRTRQWILNDRRFHWEGEARRRQKKLDQALQELMGARLSDLRATTAPQQNAVAKARAALREAEEKLRRLKYWARNYDLTAEPLAKRLGGLRSYLDQDLQRGIAELAARQRALDEYSGRRAPAEPGLEDEPSEPVV
jgi:hypothetical protein